MPGVTTVAHVVHAQQRTRIRLRHRSLQAGADGQGATGIAVAAHGLGEQGPGLLAGVRGDDHVIGFRHGKAQLVDLDRLDMLAIGGHHGQLQTGDAEIQIAHRRGVDQAQADALAGAVQRRPVLLRQLAVEQIAVGGGGHVGDVGRRHVHGRPGQPVAGGGVPALVADIADEVAEGAPVLVVVVRLLLQMRQHVGRFLVGPVGEHQHIIALVLEGFRRNRINHQRAVQAGLLLEAGVAVIPVGAALLHLEAVFVQAIRRDAGEAEAGHAIHVARQQNSVPVDRGGLIQPVAHADGHGVAFAPAQQRGRQAAVDHRGFARLAGEVHRQAVDGEIELIAGQHAGLAVGAQRPGRDAPQAEPGHDTAGPQGLEKGAAGCSVHTVQSLWKSIRLQGNSGVPSPD